MLAVVRTGEGEGETMSKDSESQRRSGTGRPQPISRRHFLRRTALTSLGCMVALHESAARGRATGSQPVEVAVDFAAPVPGVPSMSGILHGLNATAPPDEIIAPLQPNLWRVGQSRPLSLYDRVVGFGARFVLVLSDPWGYHSPWPYEDFARWEDFVGQMAQAAQGLDVIWDVWNEPNASVFWQGTPGQFFETYGRAYNVLRDSLGPDALISGPSLNQYDRNFLAAFLDSCVTNGCEVNALSWHELVGSGSRIYPIADHLAEAYTLFLENPAYSVLNIQEVHINEVIGPLDQYRPGEILGSFYYLEVGGASGACKACWRASDGTSNCNNISLDGLIVPGTAQVRAGWWAYKLYADGVPTRVQSASSDRHVAALASSNSAADDTAQVLLAYYDAGSSPPVVAVDVGLYNLRSLPFLQTAESVAVSLSRIPDTGEAELTEPLPAGELIVPIGDDGSAGVLIPAINLHEAMVLSISAAE